MNPQIQQEIFLELVFTIRIFRGELNIFIPVKFMLVEESLKLHFW